MRFVVLALLLFTGEAHAERVKLRVGTLAIDGSRYMNDITAFSAELAKRANVRLEWSTGGRLGDEPAMLALMAKGTLDGGGFSETGLIAAVSEMAVWRYPGLFRDDGEVDRATAAVDPAVRELFGAHELVFAMWADLGFARVFATEPAASLRDRLSLGAPWIKLPLDAKLFDEVTSGRAKAWVLPPLYVLAIGRVQAKSMSDLPYRYVVGGLVLSRTAWSRLSAKQQAAFAEVCREWQPRLRKSWRGESQRGIATLEKMGVRTQVATEKERATFFDAAGKGAVTYADQAGFAELMAKILAARRP